MCQLPPDPYPFHVPTWPLLYTQYIKVLAASGYWGAGLEAEPLCLTAAVPKGKKVWGNPHLVLRH